MTVSFLPQSKKKLRLISTMLQGCRLILDMRKLAVSHTARSSDEIELTSNLDLTMT